MTNEDCRHCTSTRAYCDALPGTCCTHCSHLTTQPQPTDDRWGEGYRHGVIEGMYRAASNAEDHARATQLGIPYEPGLPGPDFVGAVAQIRALHRAYPLKGVDKCAVCNYAHPCPTVTILDKAGCP
jgi:hypothetical protein